MSLDQAAAFAVKAALEPDLGQRVLAAAAGKTLTQAAMAMVRLAQQEGFDFTVDEAIQVKSTILGEIEWEGRPVLVVRRGPPKLFEGW